ncbi:uncharacterized protein LOC132062898 [Lycium ferocissimum]|uniref:uncharacterized protein LOC132062898 n=1 Tax=Lycium ferocissimum TaxID=112874 RepID=UPI0028160811|nr:uncharacterized protein LOC132062898 [Lycium ferocissimum]
MASCLFFLAIFCLPFIVKAQERSPHGLAYESPVAFSPEAYSFFHPETQKQNSTTTESLCDNNNSTSESSGCSRFPTASSLQSNLAQESLSKPHEDGDKRMGAGGMVGIALGFGFVIVLACGVYYAVIARKRNESKGVPVQLNV